MSWDSQRKQVGDLADLDLEHYAMYRQCMLYLMEFVHMNTLCWEGHARVWPQIHVRALMITISEPRGQGLRSRYLAGRRMYKGGLLAVGSGTISRYLAVGSWRTSGACATAGSMSQVCARITTDWDQAVALAFVSLLSPINTKQMHGIREINGPGQPGSPHDHAHEGSHHA